MIAWKDWVQHPLIMKEQDPYLHNSINAIEKKYLSNLDWQQVANQYGLVHPL